MALLIASLAVIAYNRIQNRLAKGRSRNKNLEIPGSPVIPTTNYVNSHIDRTDGTESLSSTQVNEPVSEELLAHKQPYYKLHTLEHHPKILSSILNGASKEPKSGILSIEGFSCNGLDHFLNAKDVDCAKR
jgi:hypothetical protein